MPHSNDRPTHPTTYLVTMALPYANGDIHMGHLVEAVQTDIFVRYQKLRGNRAIYICADDTHGTPIELSALRQNTTPVDLIAKVHENHVRDYQSFNIGFDIFYTTNSPENRYYAEYIFKKLQEAGLIVERDIEQFYCEKDARFLPDRFITGTCPRCKAANQYGDVCEECGATYDPADLADPACKLCGAAPVRKTTRHLFVDLAQNTDFLREYVNNGAVLQEDMKNFVNTWINEGLHQWCISRDGPYFGFEIPGYPNKFFYVWLDAPIGYLSSTAKWCKDHGERVEDFWGKSSSARVVHFIGKDIVYFHALFWPVNLMNAGLNLPSRIFVHGFLTVQGEKMSKTRGTFILARDFVEKVKHPQASEFLRFYYAAKLSGHAGDLDLSYEEFCSRANTTLANNIGNLHHRTSVFADRYFGSRLPDVAWDQTIAQTVQDAADEIAAAYEKVDYKVAVERIHALANLGNKYYQDNQPWELVKTKPEEAGRVIVTCMNLVRSLAVFLKPIVPKMVSLVETQLGAELRWDDFRFGLRGTALGKTVKLVTPMELTEFTALAGAGVADAGSQPRQAEPSDEGLIDIDYFGKVDLRVGTVRQAERIAESKKLLKLQVEMGGKTRQVVAGIALHYAPEDLVDKQVVVVANLKPASLFGHTSEGMVLAAKKGKTLVLVQPAAAIASGAAVS